MSALRGSCARLKNTGFFPKSLRADLFRDASLKKHLLCTFLRFQSTLWSATLIVAPMLKMMCKNFEAATLLSRHS